MFEQIDIVGTIIFVIMFAAFVVGSASYFYLKLLFLSDKRIKNWNKIPFFMLGGVVGYIEDLPDEHKVKYLRSIKVTKYSVLIFIIGFLFEILGAVISAF